MPARIEGRWQTPLGALQIAQQFQTFVGTLGPAVVTKGRLRGDAVSFTAGDTTYAGRVDGDVMHVRASDGSNGSWSARRDSVR